MGNVNSLKLANIDNCVWKAHPFTLQAPYVEYLLVEKKKKKSNGLYLPSLWALIRICVSCLMS